MRTKRDTTNARYRAGRSAANVYTRCDSDGFFDDTTPAVSGLTRRQQARSHARVVRRARVMRIVAVEYPGSTACGYQ